MTEILTPCGKARCDTQGLSRVSQGVAQIFPIPVEGERLQASWPEQAWGYVGGTLAGGIRGW